MTPETPGVLILGYGNPGRLDDGLGPALAEAIQARSLPGVTVEADYQLTVEDAAELARHRVVIFADADAAGPAPFSLTRLEPSSQPLSFSTHSVEPGDVLALAVELFGAEPEAWVLGIRGYEFDAFGERLSERAKANLDAAVQYLEAAMRAGQFQEVRPTGGINRPDPTGEEDPWQTDSA